MSTKIKLRRDYLDNWNSYNPVLGDGELGLVKDTGEIKLGNGLDSFNDIKGSFTNLDLIKNTYRLFTGYRYADPNDWTTNWTIINCGENIPFGMVYYYTGSYKYLNELDDELVSDENGTLYYNVKTEGLYYINLITHCDTTQSNNWRMRVNFIRNDNITTILFNQITDDNFNFNNWQFNGSWIEYLLPNDKIYCDLWFWTDGDYKGRFLLSKMHTHLRIFRLV